MAAKKNVAVTPAFTGRNVSLSEISQASGIGIATLKVPDQGYGANPKEFAETA